MSVTIFDSMMRPVSVRSVCSTGLSPVTVIDSWRLPTSILRSTRIVVLTSTMTPSRTTFLKPLSSADHPVGAVLQAREAVVAALVRGRVVADVGVGLGDRHGDARQGEARRIDDVAEQPALDRLRGCARRVQK